jgi:hypothetical protein
MVAYLVIRNFGRNRVSDKWQAQKNAWRRAPLQNVVDIQANERRRRSSGAAVVAESLAEQDSAISTLSFLAPRSRD